MWLVNPSRAINLNLRMLWLMNCIYLIRNNLSEIYQTTRYLSHLTCAPRSPLAALVQKSEVSNSLLILSSLSPNALFGPSHNPIYRNNILTDFKFVGSGRVLPSCKLPASNLRPKILKPERTLGGPLWSLFTTYTRLSVTTGQRLFLAHPSFYFFFLRHMKGGVVIANVSKFFTRWKDMYHLLFNLTHYQVEFLSFGTLFFKDEVLASNWKSSHRWKFMWKFIRPFLFLQPTKISNYGDYVFTHLGLYGLRIALVLDTPYHLKTLYYLHRAGFYTIAPVPINYSKDLVDFAIPTSVDSIFTQLFFIRFVLQVRRVVARTEYESLTSLWSETPKTQ